MAMPKLVRSSEVFEYIKKLFPDNQIDYREYFFAVYVNRANRVIGHSLISMGGLSGTVVDQKIIFQIALKVHASGIFLSHNHPSGELKPSNSDIQITKKICESAKILDINILDHVIVTSEKEYYSFADEGFL